MLPIVRDGLVLEMHFNELSGSTVYDLSGNNNHGTIYGATRVQEGFGRALLFDGVDDYVGIPNAPSLNPTNAITLAVWINQGTGGSSYNIPVAKYLQYFIGGRHVTDGKATFGLFFSDGSYYYLRSSSVLPTTWLNKWHFLVGVYDGSVMKLYIDGVLDNSYSISKTIRTTTNNAFIGTWGTSDWFNGTIDEVLIYNRALSDDEIKAIYNYYMKKRM